MDGNPEQTIAIEAKASEIPFATNGLQTPAIYAEDIRGAMGSDGTTKLNLVEYRMDALQEKLVAVHVVTLVLPSDKVAAWGAFLLRLGGAEVTVAARPPADSNAKA